MNEPTLSELQQQILADSEQALATFRPYFFEHLEARQWQPCEAALTILAQAPQRALQHAAQHYRAVLLSEQRQFDQAEHLLRALLREPLDAQQRARTLLELANQLDELGQWQAAQPIFQEALTLYIQLSDQMGQAKVYNNLGISLCYQVEQGVADSKALQVALTYHQSALHLAEAQQLPGEIMRNWHGIGRVYGLMGDYATAEQAFQQQLTMSQAQTDPYAEGIGLADLATLVYLPQARFAAAEAALQQALVLLAEQVDDLHLAETLTRLGNVYAQQGKETEALIAYDAALQAAESLRNRLTAPVAKIDYRTTTDFVYRAPLSLYLQRGDAANALTSAERARARALSDLLLAGQDTQAQAQVPADILEQRTQVRQELEKAYGANQPSTQTRALEAQLVALDRQIELADAEWLKLEPFTTLTATQIQAHLHTDAALLSYVTDANHRLHALVATPQRIVHVPLNPQLRMTWLQAILPEHLDGRRQGFVPNRNGLLTSTPLLSQLYHALIEPLLPHLAATQTIYIVPTAALSHLPLNALTPHEQTPPPLLADGRRVIFAPSATILFRYCHQRAASRHTGIVSVAPDHADLAFTHGAARTIARKATDCAIIGQAANRRAFLEETGVHRIVCFLGHALFHPHHPMLSHLRLSDGRLQASEILRNLRIDADLVVLAACETGRSQILRGDEILGLSRALLYAGTPALLVTAWKVHELSTRLFIEHFFALLGEMEATQQSFNPASALAIAQNWLRELTYAEAYTHMAQWLDLAPSALETHLQAIWTMQTRAGSLRATSRPFAHPFFWAPYMLIGEPVPAGIDRH